MEASDFITIGLGLATLALSLYTALKVHNFDKKKDFEDLIYQKRFETLNLLTQQIFELLEVLSLDGILGFMYDNPTNNEWNDYYEENVDTLDDAWGKLADTVHHNAAYLSNDTTVATENLVYKAQFFITTSRHRIIANLVKFEEDLMHQGFETVNIYRKDLGIELLNDSLAKRIGLKKQSKSNM